MGGGATGARYAGFIRMERAGPVWTGEIRIRRALLTWPLFRRRARRIAVGLMSDLFHEMLTTATIDLLHAVIACAHWHTFLEVTKRSRRLREYYGDPDTPRRIAEKANRLSLEILSTHGPWASPATTTAAPALDPSSRRAGRARAVGTPLHWITGFFAGSNTELRAQPRRKIGRLGSNRDPCLTSGLAFRSKIKIGSRASTIGSKRPLQRAGFASNPCSTGSCPKQCLLATAILMTSLAVTTRSTAADERSPSTDRHGSRSTGWSPAARSAPGRALRILIGCACSATNALRPVSPSSSGNGASGLRC